MADLIAKVDRCTITKLTNRVISQVSCKLLLNLPKVEKLYGKAFDTHLYFRNTTRYETSEKAFDLMRHLHDLKQGVQSQISDQFKLVYQGLVPFAVPDLRDVDGRKLVREVLERASLSDSELKSIGWEVEYLPSKLLKRAASLPAISRHCNAAVESLQSAASESNMWSVIPVLSAFGLAFAVSFTAAKVFSHYRSKGQFV
jgi:hypothetical protein